MTQGHQILKALAAAGPSTYADLSKATGILINKLRWAVNDLKAQKLVEQTEDALNQAVAWKITPAGRLRLAPPADPAGPRGLAAKGKSKGKTPSKKSVKTVIEEIRAGKASATPAAGGANNSGSSAPESLVEAANTSPGGTAGDDARAGSHGPESTAGAADDPAASTVIETRTLFDTLGRPKAQISTIKISRPGILPPTNLRIAIDAAGVLTIGNQRFFAEETILIGNFLVETKPIWSQA